MRQTTPTPNGFIPNRSRTARLEFNDCFWETQGAYAISPSEQDLKATQWRLAVSFRARRLNLEADLHAVRRVSTEGQQKSDRFIPIRFAFINKLGKDDQLQLAFDAVVLANLLSSGVNHGIIIHGTDRATTRKINT